MWAVALMFLAGVSDAPLFESQVIFAPEEMHNHGAGIVELPNGDLLAAWFHGKGEKGDDTLIIQGARKKKGAGEWSAPFPLADSQDLPDQNPVLFVDPQGRLWLFWIVSQDNTYNTYLVKYRTSTKLDGDGAPEWDWQDVIHCRPRDLGELFLKDTQENEARYVEFVGGYTKYPKWLEDARAAAQSKLMVRQGWMTRTHPIMLSETKMMLPLYSDLFGCSLAAFTEDGGRTWSFSGPILRLNVQPSFVQRENGDIVAYMRDRAHDKKIPMSVSKDGGVTWSMTESTSLPNPDSSVECIKLQSGNWLMVCNDDDGSGPRKGRSILSAYLSDDEGATWKWSRRIEKHDESCAAAYPSVVQGADGTVHVAYTYSPTPGECIKHACFNEAWVREGDR